MRKLTTVFIASILLTGCASIDLKDTTVDRRYVKLKVMVPFLNVALIDYEKETEGLAVGEAAIDTKQEENSQ